MEPQNQGHQPDPLLRWDLNRLDDRVEQLSQVVHHFIQTRPPSDEVDARKLEAAHRTARAVIWTIALVALLWSPNWANIRPTTTCSAPSDVTKGGYHVAARHP